MKIRKLIIFFALSLVLSFSALADNPKIRVGLNFGSSAVKGSISLSFENGFQAGYIDGNSFLPIYFCADNSAVVKSVGNSVHIAADNGSVLFEGIGDGSIGISPISSELNEDNYVPYTQIGSIRYPDVLEFSSIDGMISVTNIVDSEQYFKGVLPSEVYPSWHPEALKAAAVATRTYTYHSMNGKHSKYGIDLCSTTCCQVYSGVTKCQESTDRAVDETSNLVLTYNGKLITAVYHAISGGITESAAGAWGGVPESFPYLTIVSTPFENYDEIARGHWTKVLYDEDFTKLIDSSSHAGKISVPIVEITAQSGFGGYLNGVTLKDALGNSILLKTSSNVRSFFSTNSANFNVFKTYIPQSYACDNAKVLTAGGEIYYNAGSTATVLTSSGKETFAGLRRGFILDGRGHGHGVGLSQYGAQFAAKEGYTFDEILSIYYPGTTLDNYAVMSSNNE